MQSQNTYVGFIISAIANPFQKKQVSAYYTFLLMTLKDNWAYVSEKWVVLG